MLTLSSFASMVVNKAWKKSKQITEIVNKQVEMIEWTQIGFDYPKVQWIQVCDSYPKEEWSVELKAKIQASMTK